MAPDEHSCTTICYSPETIAYAAERGIAEAELPLIIDGCSGGISWLYGLGGRQISCEDCCNRHDIDYQLGGSQKDRAAADKRLLDCARARGGWRCARAWAMWACVRLFGSGHWAGE